MKSVLGRVTALDVEVDPFPHVVIENALDAEVAEKLSKEYPSPDTILTMAGGSNQRFNFSFEDLKKHGALTDTWEEFLTLHTSATFFQEFVNVFKEHLPETHPTLVSLWKSPNTVRVSKTEDDSFETHDVLMSAYMSGNTPVTTKPSTVKIAHIDNLFKPFTGLLYLRSPEDDSEGGELEFYRYKKDLVKFHGQRFIDARYVEYVKTVPYRSNTLVLFPNTLRAVHAVSVRGITPHVRKFVNLSCDVDRPFMSIDPFLENRFEKIRRRLRTDVIEPFLKK